MKTLLLPVITLIFLFTLPGCGGDRNSQPDTVDTLKEAVSTVDTTQIDKQQLSETRDPVTIFVEKFYGSLELSQELNQKQYTEGGVTFDLTDFNSCISAQCKYSKKRVENLTGIYHDRFYIQLMSIDTICPGNASTKVYTNVEYGVYEMGNFQNREMLEISQQNEVFKIVKWTDLGLSMMEKAPYDGMENFGEKEFYEMIGSLNK
ncbi:MAG: hypothetical protein KKA07_16530 [Bacteroidetes bacterium]|nr:hypothetical protein [Bacteroidota bacterium]MBU1720673.1 hypothetical protein [Bacteroidota bacterium]